MMDTTENKQSGAEQDIDIIAIARYLWSKRKLLIKSSIIAILAGLSVSPKNIQRPSNLCLKQTIRLIRWETWAD